VTVLQRPPARSVAPEIKVEALEEAAKELPPLLTRYQQESGDPDVVIDPDWQTLLRMSALGQVLFVTVRHEKIMVGFALNLFYSHPSHRTVPHVTVNGFYLDPAYRLGSFGYRFAKENLRLIEEKLKAYGAPLSRIFISAPDEGLAKLYERAGCKFLEAIYQKVVTNE
jgi:hypothetical protein